MVSSSKGNVSLVAMMKIIYHKVQQMPDQKNPDQLVADSMRSLFGSMGPAVANPVAARMGAKPLTGKFRIEGRVTRENGEAVPGISLGLLGQEAVTDSEGRFKLLIEKK
jgi:hypothetical protein